MVPDQDFSNISLDHGLDDTIKSMLDDFRTSLDSSGEIKRSVFYSLLVIYILAIIVGFCGNLLIVTAVLGRKRMRTARNVFIVTLAISDTTLCIFTMPFTLWEVRNTYTNFLPNVSINTLCNMHTYCISRLTVAKANI